MKMNEIMNLFKTTCLCLSKMPVYNEHRWQDQVNHDICVVYPRYRGTRENEGKRRFSEQEARFVFAMLLRNKKIPFSVEVPTDSKFKFGKKIKEIKQDDKGKSASHDLVAYPEPQNPVYIEFKAHNVEEHSVAKDIFKLALCKGRSKFFFQVLKTIDKATERSLKKKYDAALTHAKSKEIEVKNVTILTASTKAEDTTLFEYTEGKFIKR
jgi:hypothetical protein